MIRLLLLLMASTLACRACDEKELRQFILAVDADPSQKWDAARDRFLECLATSGLSGATSIPAGVFSEFLDRGSMRQKGIVAVYLFTLAMLTSSNKVGNVALFSGVTEALLRCSDDPDAGESCTRTLASLGPKLPPAVTQQFLRRLGQWPIHQREIVLSVLLAHADGPQQEIVEAFIAQIEALAHVPRPLGQGELDDAPGVLRAISFGVDASKRSSAIALLPALRKLQNTLGLPPSIVESAQRLQKKIEMIRP